MNITAYILITLFTILFIASFFIGPFPMPGIFYLLPAIFILTTLQLFEKGRGCEWVYYSDFCYPDDV